MTITKKSGESLLAPRLVLVLRRMFHGLSQEDVATLLGVDRSTVARWESDFSPIPKRHEERLREVYPL